MLRKKSDKEYIVQGNLKLDDINDALDTDFESEDYDTIGGLMIDCLDRLPKEGESVILENGTRLLALKVARNRILSVKIFLPDEKDEKEAKE